MQLTCINTSGFVLTHCRGRKHLATWWLHVFPRFYDYWLASKVEYGHWWENGPTVPVWTSSGLGKVRGPGQAACYNVGSLKRANMGSWGCTDRLTCIGGVALTDHPECSPLNLLQCFYIGLGVGILGRWSVLKAWPHQWQIHCCFDISGAGSEGPSEDTQRLGCFLPDVVNMLFPSQVWRDVPLPGDAQQLTLAGIKSHLPYVGPAEDALQVSIKHLVVGFTVVDLSV